MTYAELQSAIKENVRRIISSRFPNKKAFAERVGIDKTTVYQAVETPSKRDFTLPHLHRISRRLDIPIYNLLSPEPLLRESVIQEALRSHERFEMVPQIDAVACGNLAHLSGDQIIGYRAFPRELLAAAFKPFVTRATGDSMHPTISPGDLVLFDRNPDRLIRPNNEHIYLINTTPYSEELSLTVKRAKLKGRDLWLFPDNTAYRADVIEMDDKSSPLQFVLGVAVWIGRELDRTRRPVESAGIGAAR